MSQYEPCLLFSKACTSTFLMIALARILNRQLIHLNNKCIIRESEVSRWDNNDDTFAASLAKIADIYVNDALGQLIVLMRRHSTFLHCLTVRLLIAKELEFLGEKITIHLAFRGYSWCAKVSDKITVIDKLLIKQTRSSLRVPPLR